MEPRRRLNFYELVYQAVRAVPRGRVTTYSSVAKFLGNPRGSRAVGWAMRACPYPDVPCHRVVRADGLVSGRPEDAKKRIAMLRREGIKVSDNHVDVNKYFFRDFKIYFGDNPSR
ncbi:MAG TPA: MGMT family protein [Nitrososphaerales archaeon]|nr:MGMT family protein [Nitrososphaerales archaeon]